MRVEISERIFDPWRRLSEYKPAASVQHGRSSAPFGALSVFVGSMRDFNQGDRVTAMRLEHYPQMTQAHLERTLKRAAEKYAIGDALLIHRVGEVLPGEPIVLIAVWAAHRRDAYAANRRIMEELKSGAPFWKQEFLDDGARWVTQNTAG